MHFAFRNAGKIEITNIFLKSRIFELLKHGFNLLMAYCSENKEGKPSGKAQAISRDISRLKGGNRRSSPGLDFPNLEDCL